MLETAEDINATVIGAGTRTTELSGSTIEVDPTRLPLRNVPIVEVPAPGEATTESALSRVLRTATRRALDLYGDEDGHALFFPTVGALRYDRISTVARALVDLHEEEYDAGRPLIVVTEQNCAKALGQRILAASDGTIPLVVVDEIAPGDGDYLDVGAPILEGRTVPVVVKSLVFGDA